jgi:hypothetical protein
LLMVLSRRRKLDFSAGIMAHVPRPLSKHSKRLPSSTHSSTNETAFPLFGSEAYEAILGTPHNRQQRVSCIFPPFSVHSLVIYLLSSSHPKSILKASSLNPILLSW